MGFQFGGGTVFVLGKEAGLRIQLIQKDQVLPHRKRHPFHGCRMLLDDAQLIAVAQIQGVNAFGFWIRNKGVALLCHPVRLWEWGLSSYIVVNPVQNFGQRIPRPQPVETEVAFRTRGL